jgi:hypothetical protein
MLRLILRLIAHYRKPKEPTPQELVDAYLASLHEASTDALAGMLAAAMQAKKALDTTRIVDVPFPVDILSGEAALDAAGRQRAVHYISELRRFQQKCVAEGTILTTAVAKGLDVWIITLLTLTLPDRPVGAEMWSYLVRGETGVEAAWRFIMRRDITDLELEYMTYRPRLFVAAP